MNEMHFSIRFSGKVFVILNSVLDRARSSVGIGLGVDHHSHGVSVVLTILLPSIVGIIESLPLVSGVAIVVGLGLVIFKNGLAVFGDKVEIVADLASDFEAVQEQEELWFISGVKEELDLWRFIAVNFNVLESRVFGDKVVIIFINLRTDWVPRGMEVDASVNWLIGIEILNDIRNRFGSCISFAWISVHLTQLGHLKSVFQRGHLHGLGTSGEHF